MALLQVCHRWRVVAIATPSLWTDIIIPRKELIPLDKDVVRLYLKRSGSCPISLTWHYHYPYQLAVTDILLPTFARWKNLTIFSKFCILYPLFDELKLISFPVLEEFTGRYKDYESPQPIFSLRAPHLRHGVLINCMISTGTLSFLVTLQITFSGSMQQSDAAAFLDLLRNVAQSLKCLRFRIPNGTSQDYTSNTSNIQLPELVVLDLHYTSELLLFISTPNLRTLCLEGRTGDSIFPFTSLDAPMLTRLKLEKFLLSDLETIPDFPWRFRELEAVMLYQCQSGRSFFHHASSTRDSIPAFPSLRSITFTDSNLRSSVRSMEEGWEAAGPSRPALERLRFVTWDDYLWGDEVEWTTAQGIEFYHGLNVGTSWDISS